MKHREDRDTEVQGVKATYVENRLREGTYWVQLEHTER